METDLRVRLTGEEWNTTQNLRSDMNSILIRSEDIHKEQPIEDLIQDIETIRGYLSNMSRWDNELSNIHKKLVKLISDYDASRRSILTLSNKGNVSGMKNNE